MTKCELERENSILRQHVANLKAINAVLAEKLIKVHYQNYHNMEAYFRLKRHLPREIYLEAQTKMLAEIDASNG